HTGEIERSGFAQMLDAPDPLLGTTCTIARILDESAPAGRVIISAETEEITRASWVSTDLGPLDSKRLTKPPHAFRLRRRRTREDTPEQPRPITGRIGERQVLHAAW